MDKPISVGDLVMVVKPRLQCGCFSTVGRIFQVIALVNRPTFCRECGKVDGTFYDMAIDHIGDGCPLFRLKRIPPLDEFEGEKRDEKLTEPA